MKQLYSLIMVAAFVALIGLGKNVCAQQTDNYYTLCDQWNAYFNANPALKDTNDGDYTQFLRWQEFWRNHVGHSDSSLSGKLFNLRNAYLQYQPSQNSSINPSPWNFCGPQNVSGQYNGLVSAIYVDTITSGYPYYNVIYAGTNASGIWKTTDGGQNWINITDASGLYCIGINDIKGSTTNRNVLYAATGGGGIFSGTPYGIGIIRSSDGGSTWSQIYSIDPSQQIISYYILVDPTDSNRLFVGVGEKLIRLENNGTSWVPTTLFDNHDALSPRCIRDIEMKPGSPDTLYVATDSKSSNNYRRAQVLRVTGATTNNYHVQELHPFCNDTLYSERYEIAVSPLTPKSIYVVGQYNPINSDNVYYVAIWKSVDDGVTWQLKYLQEEYQSYDSQNYLGGGRVDYFKMELKISPTDTNILYVGGNTMSRLNQGTWTVEQTTGYIAINYHPDTRATVILHGSSPITHGVSDVLICGNDGGVSRTNNGINNWLVLNGIGLWITEFWGMGSSDYYPNWICGGTTDNGFFNNKTGFWSIPKGGEDAAGTLVDFQMPNIVYLNCIGGTQISTDFGANFPRACNPTGSETSLYNQPLALNPKNTNIMYSGAHDLYRNNNMHSNPLAPFSQIPVHLNLITDTIASGEEINSISVSATDTSTILFSYAGPTYQQLNDEHKLLVTHDGGLTYVDILAQHANSGLLNILKWNGITSVAISDDDVHKMWVAIGGFSGHAGQGKVYYSSDEGITFTDVSAGLPDFPMNCLRYWKGGADRIFVGTDVGVFYMDNTLSSWQPYNTGLPITMITDLEVLPNNKILRASTYGRGIWQTYLHSCKTTNNPLIITSDETWTTPTNMDRSIDIKAPATLTIKTIVRFPGMTKIMVEPGATLVCDTGCDLTNYCQDMWLGVEVWGNSTLQQLPDNQGVVYIKDSALLENARIGITTCRKDNTGNIDWTTTGGMIHAYNNPTFKNNYKAIEFLSYPFQQNSLFKNVNFITQGAFCDLVSSLQTFVSLYNIDNLRFEACNFNNFNNPNTNIPPPSTNGMGIISIDADYSVLGQCLGTVYPCSKWTPSVFNGLFYGINANNTNPTNTVVIDESNFVNNYRGVYLSGVDFAQTTSSTFQLPKDFPPNFGNDTVYGLYLNTCTGYNIQENQFNKVNGQNIFWYPAFIGIVVNNSGIDPNEIYNNSFNDVGIGILAQHQNRSRDGQM